jgi:hypothetical protein
MLTSANRVKHFMPKSERSLPQEISGNERLAALEVPVYERRRTMSFQPIAPLSGCQFSALAGS